MSENKTGKTYSYGVDFTECPGQRPAIGERRLLTDIDPQTDECNAQYICEIIEVRDVPRTTDYYTYPTTVGYRVVQKVSVGRGSAEAERLQRAGKVAS